MPKDITEKLGLSTEVTKFKLKFANLSSKSLLGVVNNLEVKVGNCIVPINLHVFLLCLFFLKELF